MRLPSIGFDRTALSNIESAIQKEWLITNGLGGYASSTVLGVNTRKYHGLLVAAMNPPRDRRVFLEKLDEEIISGNDVCQLAANEFQNGIFPQRLDVLEEFSISPFPKYVYTANSTTVQKMVFMPHERNCAVALYNISNESNLEVKMRVFPLVNWRHFHSVTDRRKASEFRQEQENSAVKISFQTPQSTLLMKGTDGQYVAKGKWIEKVYFREEAHRGESCLDDWYQLGYFETSVEAGKTEDFAIVAVVEQDEDYAAKVLKEVPSTVQGLEALHEKEVKRHKDFLTRFYDSHEDFPVNDWLDWLVLASDTFVVKGLNSSEKSVVAGYHWFSAWGRDTFVSLPGLLLVTGRFEDARTIFLGFARYCKEGLILNFFSDEAGPPAYNTVDATLWYINALLQYLKYTGDFKFVEEQLWEILRTIIESHVKGTVFNIHVDADCLLSHGPQLTWVDAAVYGEPVSPRAGKAVEVQALWYNALKTMELLANRFGESNEAERYAQMAQKASKSFVKKFWNGEKDCLCDVVGDYERDGSLRPNQVIAVALDFVMLNNAMNERVLDVVQRELLTPFGLRTLPRNDPRYIGVYSGDRASRDRAYHNGTVWPWLLGPLTTAFLKAKGDTGPRREYAFQIFLKPLLTQEIYRAGLGSLSEIFDGDPPHTPRGCIAQAWSVAEPFRAYVEDILQIRPRYERKVL
jgi:predicted glycogen debranching enzyme